jgi:hypothetical protein
VFAQARIGEAHVGIAMMKRMNMSPYPVALMRMIPLPLITRWSFGWIPGGT